MTFSGSDDFNLTRNQIIMDAMQLINCYSPECDGALNAGDLTFASNRLNSMVKAWDAQGLHLWTTQEAILFLTQGQTQYNLALGNTTPFISPSNVVSTYLTVTAAAAATTITVNSATGLSNGMNIGICLDSGTIQWTTITNVASLVITLNAALTSQASANENIYAYSTANVLDRPLRILSGRVVTSNVLYTTPPSTIEIAMTRMSRDEFYRIPNKLTQSQPTCYYYDPQIPTGVLNVWPSPYSSLQYLRLTYEAQIQDFDNPTDNANFPQEWLECIVYNLALRLAPAYGKTTQDVALLQQMAAQFLDDVKNFDVELTSVYLMPSKYRNN